MHCKWKFFMEGARPKWVKNPLPYVEIRTEKVYNGDCWNNLISKDG